MKRIHEWEEPEIDDDTVCTSIKFGGHLLGGGPQLHLVSLSSEEEAVILHESTAIDKSRRWRLITSEALRTAIGEQGTYDEEELLCNMIPGGMVVIPAFDK